jgi:hypothetical protein
MNKKLTAYILSAGLALSATAFAGNDSKRGQAGASELLINPWARSSGWANANTSGVRGVEAMNLNLGGLAYVKQTEFIFSNVQYLSGSGVQINSLGFGRKVSETGTFGLSVTSLSLGDFTETTYALPEGTGAKFNPQFFNMGIAYSKIFSSRISAGILVRVISQSIPDASAQGVAFDAGVQYQAGEQNQFKFGASLRNLGPKMQYRGDGFSFRGNRDQIGLTLSSRTAQFDMPALLNVGTSYDFNLAADHRITTAFNFVSNSYTKDNIQFGAEYGFKDYFMFRGGLNYQKDVFNSNRTDAHTGPTFGATLQLPFGLLKSSKPVEGSEEAAAATTSETKSHRSLGLDYSYRATNPFSGTHTVSLILKL